MVTLSFGQHIHLTPFRGSTPRSSREIFISIVPRTPRHVLIMQKSERPSKSSTSTAPPRPAEPLRNVPPSAGVASVMRLNMATREVTTNAKDQITHANFKRDIHTFCVA